MSLTRFAARPRGRRLPHAVLLSACAVCLLLAHPLCSVAQQPPQNPDPLPPPVVVLDEAAVERLIEKRLKEREAAVRAELNTAFGSSVSLLSLLTGILSALAGVLTLIPVLTAIFFFVYRSSIQQQMTSQIATEAEKHVREKFKAEVDSKVAAEITKFEGQLQTSASQLKGTVEQFQSVNNERLEVLHEELNRKAGQIHTQQMLRRLIRLIQRSFKTQMERGSSGVLVEQMRREIEATRAMDGAKLTFLDRLNVGMFTHIVGQYEDAVREYDLAIGLASGDRELTEAWMMKGDALYRLHDYEGALAAYSESVSKDGRNFEALTYRGNSLYRLERFDEAIKSLDDAIAINPLFPDAPFYKARCYARMGQPGPAVESLRRAIELNPGCWEEANLDRDFDPVKNTPEFKKLNPFAIPAA